MPSTLLFFTILLVSVFIIISSPTWLGAWVALEVNLIRFIPLMLSRVFITSVESCIKYFLVQAFSSLLLLVSVLTIIGDSFILWMDFTPHLLTLGVALIIKLGAAPFHFWFPAVSSGIGWSQNFILITFQKVGPLVILNYIWGILPVSTIIIICSVFVGSVGGLNQSSLRKLIAYSSINHLGWLLTACYFGIKFLLIYFIVYILTNLFLVGLILRNGFFYLSQIYYYGGSGVRGVAMIVAWFSFGGLPPFIGFLGKWLVIDLIVHSTIGVICVFIVAISLVSLYYYTRVCYTIMRQSGGLPLLNSRIRTNGWSLYLNVGILISSLVLAPIFVLLL